MPEGIELLQGARDLAGHGQTPQAVELDHDVHLVAHRLTDLAKRLEGAVEIWRADVLAVGLLSGHIEGPDLHARDALRQQRQGQLVGVMKKALQIFIRPGVVTQAPVRAALVDVAADVLVARAGVVDADGVAALAAQSRVHRHASGFAKEIPQGDVNGRIAARLDARAAPAQITGQITRSGFDGQRILPNELGSGPLVQIGLDGLRAHKRLAQADQTLVGVQPDPQDIGKLAQPNGFKLRDLHRLTPTDEKKPATAVAGSCKQPA